MVVTTEAHATAAGVRILQAGGNAVDAAVAVGLALAVTHPAAGNLGGGGFLLARFADGRTTFVDFRERAPAHASRDMYLNAQGKATDGSRIGYRAAGVPGSVQGFEFAANNYGRLPWALLCAPAIELASKGFAVSEGLARSLKSSHKLLERFPDSKRIFLRDGRYYAPGEVLVQPDLARTLDRIARFGAADFYHGETARLIAKAMDQNSGAVTLADLKDYSVVERQPLIGEYRGYRIVTAPPPSSGGIGLLQMLGVLDGTGFQKDGAGSVREIHFAAEAMRRFYADRSEYLGDPDFTSVPVAALLNARYIAKLRQSIDPERATPSNEIHPGDPAAAVQEPSETTHYSIVDREGNAVAVTYTLNGSYGCGATVPGAGFLLNNEMDDFAAKPGTANMFGLVQGERNAIAPRKRPLSSMTPTIVLRNGRLYMVLGSPGGGRIITTVLEVLLNSIDFGMNIQDAVDAPRFHHQWQPDTLYMEPKFSPETVAALAARGYRIERIGAMGDVAAILVDGEWLQGAADRRAEGTAAGY
jgi:gamma-glutamyltranspeptidase/glutathione hydrolase